MVSQPFCMRVPLVVRMPRIGRRISFRCHKGRRDTRSLCARHGEFLRGLELDHLALGIGPCIGNGRGDFVRRLAFHERLLHFGMFLDMLAFRMRIFRMDVRSFFLRGMRGNGRLRSLLRQLFGGGSSGALVLLCHEVPTPGRIEVRHRGVADGAIKVACGKGGAFYAKWSGLTKRKAPLVQRLPLVFDPLINAKFGPKGSSAAKNLSRVRAGPEAQGFALRLATWMATLISFNSARSSSSNIAAVLNVAVPSTRHFTAPVV